MTADPGSFREVGRRLSNWGRWGDDDQLGTLNLIDAAAIVRAASLVRTGRVFDLSIPLDDTGPQRGAHGRHNPIHAMTIADDTTFPAGMFLADDMAVLSLQGATQWDSLAHVGYDKLLYNGVPITDVTVRGGATRNGIDRLGARVLGRGVLLDVPRALGRDAFEDDHEITPADLEAAEAAHGVSVGAGDVLLVRTGWIRHLHRGDVTTYMTNYAPGIGLAACAWLHDRGVAAVATDTQAVEVKPPRDDRSSHPVHLVLIRDVGMTLGEMFDLEELADDCAADGVHEFLFTAQPLKITGAVGSPITPVAVK